MIALLAVAWGAVTLETPPEAGVETVVAVQDAEGDPRGGVTVRVVMRPGLGGERELAVGITDGRGRIRWTPEDAGVAWLRAGDESLRVRVAGAPPGSALLSLGALILGGVAAVVRGITSSRR